MIEYGIIVLATVIVFWRTLLGGYVVDDEVRLSCFKTWRKAKFAGLPLSRRIFDSLYGGGMFKYAFQEYVFNMCLHAASCCLIYKATGSLLAAMLYLINPVNNQTAIWMNGRRYAVAVFMVLLAWNFQWLALPAFAFGVWIHHSAMFFPALFMFTPFAWVAPIALAMGGLISHKHIRHQLITRKEQFAPNNELQKIHPKKAIVYVKSMGYYFFHCLIPLRPGMYHDFLYYYSRYDWANKQAYSFNFDFFKGAAVISFLGYETIWCHNMWAFWFGLFISQWCNIYTVTMNSSDRYCSMANVGAMVLLSQYIGKIPHPYNEVTIAVVATFYLMKYQPLIDAYKNVEAFYNYHINLNPAGVEARVLLATAFMNVQDPMSAYYVIKKGLKHNPRDFKLLLIMAQILLFIGRRDSGLQTLQTAEKYVPDGEHEEARVEFQKIRDQFAGPKPHIVVGKSK